MTILSHVLTSFEPTMPVGMLAGLLAAYGRELSNRRRPRWRWWFARILLLPAAAITSVAVDGSLGLSSEARALMVMLMVFRGYDGMASSTRIWPARIMSAASRPHSGH